MNNMKRTVIIVLACIAIMAQKILPFEFDKLLILVILLRILSYRVLSFS
jgi:hypothetical protein